MNEISFSVIIVNYNTFKLTCDCIESILAYEKNSNFEIILVDNNSSELPASEFKKKFPNIILIESPTNVGFAKGNNLGIEHAKGKCILLMNSDTKLKNKAPSICQTFLENNKDVAVAVARLEYPDGRIQHSCQRFPSAWWLLLELLRLQKIFPAIKKHFFGSFFDYQSVEYPDWAWGTFFMFKKALLKELPNQKLADDFFMYVEDMQWCKDFKRLGYKTVFLPNAQVIHMMEGSNGNKNSLITQNMEAFMQLYYSSTERLLIEVLNLLLTGRYGY